MTSAPRDDTMKNFKQGNEQFLDLCLRVPGIVLKNRLRGTKVGIENSWWSATVIQERHAIRPIALPTLCSHQCQELGMPREEDRSCLCGRAPSSPQPMACYCSKTFIQSCLHYCFWQRVICHTHEGTKGSLLVPLRARLASCKMSFLPTVLSPGSSFSLFGFETTPSRAQGSRTFLTI